MPMSRMTAIEPAHPKSTSSGWAVMTSTRSMPEKSMASITRDATPVTESPFSPRELVGLLADDDRRRVFAALVLGANDADAVRRDTGMDARAAGRALQRLV